jgi:L-lactate dehydrogenase complex protein LldE
MRRVGLFIPCYMDAFEPEVGIATLELLERLFLAASPFLWR